MRVEENNVIALVPMRHQSERVPGKNYRPLAGKPLYTHILESLLICPQITGIVVDTDSKVIKEGIAENFPSIRLIDRPKHLRRSDTPMNQVLLHDIDQLPGTFYLQTHSTNPLLRPATISLAIESFFQTFPEKDSLFSVTRLKTRLWDCDGQPVNHNPIELLRTQDLPPIYEENSCLYIFECSIFKKRGNRLGERPLMFEIEASEAWDIDEELDFRIVDFLVQQRMVENRTMDE